MSPPFQLDPSAKRALGNLSPQDAWSLLVSQAFAAVEIDQEKCEQLAESLHLFDQPDDNLELHDLDDLQEILRSMNPVKGVNLFHDLNPSFNLQRNLEAYSTEY